VSRLVITSAIVAAGLLVYQVVELLNPELLP
jgi:K+-transporting ATPase KdpF subunit